VEAKQPKGGTCVRSALLENSRLDIVLDLSRRDGEVTLWMYATCAMAKCQKRLGVFLCHCSCTMSYIVYICFGCSYRVELAFDTYNVVR